MAPYLYGTHYSAPGYVLYWLARLAPAHHLRLNGGRFDAPDRMFHGVAESWASALTSTADVKELVPEFFIAEEPGAIARGPEDGEDEGGGIPIPAARTRSFLGLDGRAFDAGTRQKDGATLGDVKLPPWARGSRTAFLRRHRDALESEVVSRRLHLWIDLVFGSKQTGPASIAADNAFHPLTTKAALEASEDAALSREDLETLEAQIDEFGQAPRRLFAAPHPPRAARVSEEAATVARASPEIVASFGGAGIGADERPIESARRSDRRATRDLSTTARARPKAARDKNKAARPVSPAARFARARLTPRRHAKRGTSSRRSSPSSTLRRPAGASRRTRRARARRRRRVLLGHARRPRPRRVPGHARRLRRAISRPSRSLPPRARLLRPPRARPRSARTTTTASRRRSPFAAFGPRGSTRARRASPRFGSRRDPGGVGRRRGRHPRPRRRRQGAGGRLLRRGEAVGASGSRPPRGGAAIPNVSASLSRRTRTRTREDEEERDDRGVRVGDGNGDSGTLNGDSLNGASILVRVFRRVRDGGVYASTRSARGSSRLDASGSAAVVAAVSPARARALHRRRGRRREALGRRRRNRPRAGARRRRRRSARRRLSRGSRGIVAPSRRPLSAFVATYGVAASAAAVVGGEALRRRWGSRRWERRGRLERSEAFGSVGGSRAAARDAGAPGHASSFRWTADDAGAAFVADPVTTTPLLSTLACDPLGALAIVGGHSGEVAAWDPRYAREVWRAAAPRDVSASSPERGEKKNVRARASVSRRVSGVVFAPCLSKIITASEDGVARLLDLRRCGEPLDAMDFGAGALTCAVGVGARGVRRVRGGAAAARRRRRRRRRRRPRRWRTGTRASRAARRGSARGRWKTRRRGRGRGGGARRIRRRRRGERARRRARGQARGRRFSRGMERRRRGRLRGARPRRRSRGRRGRRRKRNRIRSILLD